MYIYMESQNNRIRITSSTNQFHYSYWFVSVPAFALVWSTVAACAHLSGRWVEAESAAYGAEAHGGSELGSQHQSNAVGPLHHLLGPGITETTLNDKPSILKLKVYLYYVDKHRFAIIVKRTS